VVTKKSVYKSLVESSSALQIFNLVKDILETLTYVAALCAFVVTYKKNLQLTLINCKRQIDAHIKKIQMLQLAALIST
jgi:hypothetical protein